MRARADRRRCSGVTRAGSLALVLALVAVVGVACTADPVPTPPVPAPDDTASDAEAPSGIRVGIVLPPSGTQETVVAQALRDQLAALVERPDSGVLQLRAHPVPSGAVASDVVGWLAERRVELVCALGEQAERAVAEAAALYRGVRFCALPVDPPPEPAPDAAPDPSSDTSPDAAQGEGATDDVEDRPAEALPPTDAVLRVGLRAEELGELVGVAAREQAGGEPVGLVLGGGVLPRDAFRAGLLTGLAGADVIEAGGGDPEVGLADRAEAVVQAGAAVVVLDGAAGARSALDAVGDRAAVFGPDTLDASRRPPLTLGWIVRWDRVFAAPLAQVVEGRTEPAHISLGLSDGVFEVVTGSEAADAVADAIASARARIASRRASEAGAAVSPG